MNHLIKILISLAKSNVQFILCGGVASVLYGVQRLTVDLDLSIEMSEINLKKFLKVMKDLNLSPRAPVPPEDLLVPDNRKKWVNEKNALVFTFIDNENPFRQVDIFLTEELAYDRLIDDVKHLKLIAYNIPTVSIDTLIKMKSAISPTREKDLFDIKELKKIRKEINEKKEK